MAQFAGATSEAPVERAETVATDNAFPTGFVSNAAAGFLYFAYHGKAEKIRSVELIYRSPDGEKSIALK